MLSDVSTLFGLINANASFDGYDATDTDVSNSGLIFRVLIQADYLIGNTAPRTEPYSIP